MEEIRSEITVVEGDGGLEKSLEAYERGVKLVILAQEYLSQAEQRVNILNTDSEETEPESGE